MSESEQRILIIDPHHDQQAVMATYLRSESYEVETGGSLADAIKMLEDRSFCCLILDVDLPEMKGYEAVPILKRIHPDLKIIMTTQKNHKDLEAQVRKQDIFFYFIKSFGKEELKLAIQNAFSK